MPIVHCVWSGTHAAAVAVFVSLLLLHVAALHILKEVGRASAGKPNSTKRAENNTTNINQNLDLRVEKKSSN